MSQETRATIRLAKLSNAPTLKDLRALLETAKKNAGTNVELSWELCGRARSYQLMARCGEDGSTFSWTMRVIDGFEARRIWNSDTTNLDVVCETACKLSGAPPPSSAGNGGAGANRAGAPGASAAGSGRSAAAASPSDSKPPARPEDSSEAKEKAPPAAAAFDAGQTAVDPPPGWWQVPDMDIMAAGPASEPSSTPQGAPSESPRSDGESHAEQASQQTSAASQQTSTTTGAQTSAASQQKSTTASQQTSAASTQTSAASTTSTTSDNDAASERWRAPKDDSQGSASSVEVPVQSGDLSDNSSSDASISSIPIADVIDKTVVVSPVPPVDLAIDEDASPTFLDEEIDAQYQLEDDETATWEEQENEFGLTGEASGAAQFLSDQLIEQKIGLYAYPALLMLLEQQFYRYEANKTPVSLILFSMSHIDGTAIPPQCVTTAALRIGLVKQRLDVLARFEETDFAILMPHTTTTRAVLTASRALEALRASALAPGFDGKVMHFAFGVATLQENGSVESLIAAAKAAMKRARQLACPIHVAR